LTPVSKAEFCNFADGSIAANQLPDVSVCSVILLARERTDRYRPGPAASRPIQTHLQPSGPCTKHMIPCAGVQHTIARPVGLSERVRIL